MEDRIFIAVPLNLPTLLMGRPVFSLASVVWLQERVLYLWISISLLGKMKELNQIT